MTDQSLPDPRLLDGYLAGTLAPDERAQFEAWLASHQVTAAMLRDLPRLVAGADTVADTESSWQQLVRRIEAANSGDDLAVRRQQRNAPRPWMRRVAALAAALTIIAGGGATWRALRGTGGSIAAPAGHDVSATLPDGTRITVAAGSTVAWQGTYGRGVRDVTLEGEALFDVVHDTTRPFRVHSRNAIAEDVGTRFVMRAWRELPGVDVAVEEGIVALADSAQASSERGTLLHAGQRGRLIARVVQLSADADVATAWTRGTLAFDNQPLTEVLPAIGRRFDVTVQAAPSLASRRLTARFAAQSLDEVLKALALALDVQVTRNGRTITLSPAVP